MDGKLTFRQRVKLFDSRSGKLDSETLKSNYRTLARVAILGPDPVPDDPRELLGQLSLPEDYEKLVGHLGVCTPKTRRIADRCLGMWDKIDSRIYIALLKCAFFDASGNLKSDDIGSLFRDFHAALRAALGKKDS